MIRYGLCCIFCREPIRFRTATAKRLGAMRRRERLSFLSTLCRENVESLYMAVETVHRLGIGAFRITSPLFPRITHPAVGYRLFELPAWPSIRAGLRRVAVLRERLDVRLSFHPDQFVILSSPHPEVVAASRRELAYQADLARRVGAEVINIHAGGAYGDKRAALDRFCRVFRRLPKVVRARLTLENDDVTYTVSDLLPVCDRLGIPLVYDVHHHRCNPDGLSEREATRLCLGTWAPTGRAPWFHLSSPRDGWRRGNPRPHADYVRCRDFPAAWKRLTATVDIEAKAKELAVVRLMRQLARGCRSRR